ncbi:MAG TPA: amidohydrolase family protein [Candidatus Dormibacteraeota bacterium]|nr:amidohydrolase family protein [Candidatus Dormibacteraeota bacterium]
MRKIDLHCYPGTQPWIDSYGPFAKALGAYWKHDWVAKSEEEVIGEFRAAGVEAVLVAFDIESVTGAPPCTNDYVAGMRDRHGDTVLQAWAAVDPLKMDAALVEARHAIVDLGMLGFHFHPIMGRYSVDDHRLRPLFELIDSLKAPVMIDVGTTGMGAGLPGGLGSKLRHAHPLAIDELASEFPNLTIIAAHPGWPWVEEMTAVALHKGNVFWELSGWAPKYFPDSLKKDIRGRLRDKVMFGSDYPSLPYERVLGEWQELGYSSEVMDAVFHGNAERALPLGGKPRTEPRLAAR